MKDLLRDTLKKFKSRSNSGTDKIFKAKKRLSGIVKLKEKHNKNKSIMFPLMG